jgi:hypothetical protein
MVTERMYFITSDPWGKQQRNAEPRAPKLPRPFPIKAFPQWRTSGERYFLLDPDHPTVGALTDEERWEWGIIRRLSEIGNEIAARYPEQPDETFLEYVVMMFEPLYSDRRKLRRLFAPWGPVTTLQEKRLRAQYYLGLLESFRSIPGKGHTVEAFCKFMADWNQELPKDQQQGSGATTVSGWMKYIKEARKATRKRLGTLSAKKRTGTKNRKNRD